MDNIPCISLLKYQYVKALYTFSNGNIDEALIFFEDYKKEIESILSTQKSGENLDKMILHDYIASLRWYSECLYLSVKDEHDPEILNDTMAQAFAMLDDAITLASSLKFERAIVHSYLIRIKFHLDIVLDMDNVGKMFKELKKYESTIKNDAMYRHEYQTLIEKYNNRGG